MTRSLIPKLPARRHSTLACGLAITLGTGALLGAATPAIACPLLDLTHVVADAPVAFVGTVQGVHKRVATILVQEVWRGPDLPRVIDVVVGDGQPLGYSTGDRTFEAGARYLIVPFFNHGRLQDNVCSMTQPWTDGLAALRPTDARPPADESPFPFLFALSTAALLALIGLIAFRPRRASPTSVARSA